MRMAKTCLVAAVAASTTFSAMAESTAAKPQQQKDSGSQELVMLDMRIARNGDEFSKPCIFVRNADKGEYKCVTEYIYPTDYDLQVAGTNGVNSWAVEPQCFTMREVGLIVEATPTIVKGMIDLKLKVSIVDEPVWKNYGFTMTDMDGKKKELPMEQPFFKTQVVENRLLLRPDVSTTIHSDGVSITVTPRIINAAKIDADKARSAKVVQRMKAMRLPAISFKPPATIVDAVEFFSGASKDYDSPNVQMEKRGFNFVLRTNGSASAPVVPMISARDISFYDALALICESVGYKFEVSGEIVIVKPSDAKP